VLIKTGRGDGDLESSQRRTGVPGETGRVSVVGRKISFLTEIFASRGRKAKRPQNVG
jgi:hypothetical protein